MSKRSSTFVRETRANEAWIEAYEARERDAAEANGEQPSVLPTAALVHGALDAVPVPATAEAASRARVAEEIVHAGREPEPQRPVAPPWYLRVGQRLGTVFPFNKRR